ncbi:MAG TPA: hypothetical protein VFG45_00185 [Candidatus Nitrosocosmicus sp.]|nr:hypothetical protein [Candidatus Nitrosocosmicus sp.]
MIITLIAGFTTSNASVYGQLNETDGSIDNTAQVISNPEVSEERDGNSGEQLTPGDSSSNTHMEDSSGNNENITSNELNRDTSDSDNSRPDGDCLFDPSLSKCAPNENGDCPEGFNMNEDGQCFPQHNDGCPDGYHGVDDDETGRCIPNSEGCPSGMIFRPNEKSCGYKDDICKQYPNLEDCKTTNEEGDDETKKTSFDSGYSHGCSDAKISDESKRYINQPGNDPDYHTSSFMNGYHKGFDYCSKNMNDIPYDSGYKHGCNDATITDVSERYINQPGKDPSFHTADFMDGYNGGFADCIKPGNKGPIADAGPSSIEVTRGETVTLDATKSYDTDGQIVKYDWRNGVNADPGCPYGTFINKNSPTPQFTPPDDIRSDCSNYYEVVVTDNFGKSGIDAILITVVTTSNSSNGVIMSNVHQSPNPTHVGDKFGIGATITNNLDKSIHYISPDCGGKTLEVELDKSVNHEGIVVCQSVQDYTLGPHESTDVGSGIPSFIAVEPGQINSQVTFDYDILGSNESSKPLTKSFSFEVLLS